MIGRLPGKLQFTTLIFCSVTFGTPVVAQAAQDDPAGWQFVVAPYLLLPHMNGDMNVGGTPSEVDVGPGDIFENLDFGAMLYLEMANPNWAITVDGYYVDLGGRDGIRWDLRPTATPANARAGYRSDDRWGKVKPPSRVRDWGALVGAD